MDKKCVEYDWYGTKYRDISEHEKACAAIISGQVFHCSKPLDLIITIPSQPTRAVKIDMLELTQSERFIIPADVSYEQKDENFSATEGIKPMPTCP